jgi:hypothetical protein
VGNRLDQLYPLRHTVLVARLIQTWPYVLICRDEVRQRLASTGVVYDSPSDRFITFSQLSIGLAA